MKWYFFQVTWRIWVGGGCSWTPVSGCQGESQRKPETGSSRGQWTRGSMLKSYCGNRCWVFKNQTRPKAKPPSKPSHQKSEKTENQNNWQQSARYKHAHTHTLAYTQQGWGYKGLTSRTTPSRAGWEIFLRLLWFNFGALSARLRPNDWFDVLLSALLSIELFEDLWLISNAERRISTFEALPMFPWRGTPLRDSTL